MKPSEYRRRRDLIWRRVRQQMRSILMFDGVPVTPEHREAAAQKILFPVRRAREESTQLATDFFNGEAVRAGRPQVSAGRSPFYPREAVEAVLERATASKVRIDGLDVVPATPTQTARVEGLEVAPTRSVVIEGLDDLGVELERARVEIDESNRRDPAVVEKVNLRVDRAIIRHIEQAARDTIVAAVEAEEERSGDPIGWARVLTGAESCGFCAMLASRGPIYKTEETAQRRGKNQEEGKYHDGCDCLIVPVFDIDDDWVGKDAWENLEQLWIESDGRKDFEKRIRELRDRGDLDPYVGAADSGTATREPPGPPVPPVTKSAAGGDGDKSGINWPPHLKYGTKDHPHPHRRPVWTAQERVDRQAALGIDLHGEELYQHEIESVERMQALGAELKWIRRLGTEGQTTNDAVWIGGGEDRRGRRTDIEIELKATKAKQSSIIDVITKCFVRAEKADRRGDAHADKKNFVIDIGDGELTDTLNRQLSMFNERRRDRIPPRQIEGLWIMTRGNLVEVEMQ
ncbi:hypothetical protein BH787_gp04 [Gordonia phage GMA4]|uniref:hypothetical protein n=1 Tax=Gordonia phage GMA4 TaxID=1647471 RepID=UPI0006BD65DE|nr:hypothetical protein BH787_gp04 [Gordonia phage GMA4]AKJ72279.1 hypothetical protein GMA4_4 [Gordonia phage GMA4]